MFPRAFAKRSALVLVAASVPLAIEPVRANEAPAPAAILSDIPSTHADHGPFRSPLLADAGNAASVRAGAFDGEVKPPPPPRIVIGPQALSEGSPRFAARTDVSGTALIVSFADTEPRLSLNPGSLPTHAPVSGRLTGSFGWRADPFHGSSRFHSGVDLAAPAGSPIVVTADGSVSSAGWAGNYGYMVVVDHGNGVETRYAHMSAVAVEAGRAVREGEVLGYVGSTGRSTGPHVHYEVRIGGRAVDPLSRR